MTDDKQTLAQPFDDEFKSLIESAPMGLEIFNEIMDIGRVLLEKNTAYGNSVLEPIRVFSRANSIEQIRVRIDDKLSRLTRGSQADN